jgi:uncharacterized protein
MVDAALAAARRFFQGLFFYPDQDNLGLPPTKGLDYEDVRFRSGDDELHGFLLKAKGPARGVVVHCHGNAGNVTAHFPLVGFLTAAGFDVLTFDYAGFGKSTGRPSLEGIEENARAALAYVLGRKDLRTDRVAIFGQSLGGAAAAAAAPHPSVKCLVLEATFTTYRDIAWATFIGRVLFFLVPGMIPDGGPARHLGAFAPRPVFLVHGNKDSVVRASFSRRLHDMFPAFTTLHIEPLVGHLTPGLDESTSFGGEILNFLDRHLAGS